MIVGSDFLKWCLIFGITPGGGDGTVVSVLGTPGQISVDSTIPETPVVKIADNPMLVGITRIAPLEDTSALNFLNSTNIPPSPVGGISIFSQFDEGLGRSVGFYKDDMGNVYQFGAGIGGEGTVTLVDTTADITVNGVPAGSFTVSGTLGLANHGTAGSYAYPSSITTDAKGRVTTVVSGSAPTLGTVTLVDTDTDLTVNGVAGDGFTVSGTLGLANAGAPGTYAYPSSITTDAKGRVTAVVSGSAPGNGTVTSVITDTTLGVNGVPGATITTSGTLGLVNHGTAGSYAYPSSITTDAKGRVTTVVSGSAPTLGTVTQVDTTLDLTVDGVAGDGFSTSGTLGLVNTGTAGSYTYPSSITTDAKGRITVIVSGVAPGNGTVTQVDTTTDLTVDGVPGENFTTSGTLGLANHGTAGAYAYPSSITTDAKGRVTAVVPGIAPSGGTVTLINTNNGIIGGPVTTAGTLQIDPAYISYDPVRDNVVIGGATIVVDPGNTSMVSIGDGAKTSGEASISIGRDAGSASTGIVAGIFIGADSDATDDNLTNCMALGTGARVSTSDAFSYGNNNVRHGFGTRAPTARMHCFGDHIIQGATEGNTSSFPPAGKYTSQTYVKTTNEDETILLTVVMPNLGIAAAGSVTSVEVRVVAVDGAGAGGAAFNSSLEIWYSGSTYEVVGGSLPTITPRTIASLVTVEADWMISGSAILLAVTGVPGTNINWITTYTVVSTAAGLTT